MYAELVKITAAMFFLTIFFVAVLVKLVEAFGFFGLVIFAPIFVVGMVLVIRRMLPC